MFEDRSLWWMQAEPYRPAPALRGDRTVDICILGGGLTGLSTAYHLRRKDRAAGVALLEAEQVGAGASGRNAGQHVIQFGGDWSANLRRFGGDAMHAALNYVAEGTAIAERLSADGLRFDYRRTGTLKVGLRADGPAMLDAYHEYLVAAGQERHLSVIDAAQVQEEIASPYLANGVFDERGGTNDPLKLTRGLRQLAEAEGAQVFEHSPAIQIVTGTPRIRVETGMGSITCSKLILALNGYTHLLGGVEMAGLSRSQRPMIVRATATERLGDGRWEAAGWRRRCGINVVSRLFFSFAPTADGRVVTVAGHRAHAPTFGSLSPSTDWRLRHEASDYLGRFFPALRGAATEQSWGGAISLSRDEVPHIGQSRDPRILYTGGCWGAGVPLGLRNGITLADLALDRRSPDTDLWFVRRAKADWPLAISGLAMSQVLAARRRKARHLAGRLDPPLIIRE